MASTRTRPPPPSHARQSHSHPIRLTQQQQFRLLDSYNKQQYTTTAYKKKRTDCDADEIGDESTRPPSTTASNMNPISSLSTTQIQQRPSAYSRFHPLPRLNQSVIKDVFQPKSKTTKPTEATTSTAVTAAAFSVTSCQHQTMLEYAREHQLVYQPCCLIERMLQEGIELLSEQRRINTLIRALLSQSHPDLLPPPSRYGWCHLLANDEPHLRRHSLIGEQFLPAPTILDRLQERGTIQIPQLKQQFISEWNADQERRPHTLANFNNASSMLHLSSSSSPSSLIAAAASRDSHFLYTSLDCCVCWSELRDGTELYKMTCCHQLVHLQCMNHIIGLKATAERRQCTACHQSLDRDELESIKEEIVRTKQRKRFVTSHNRKLSSVQVNESTPLSPVVEELSQPKEDDPEAAEPVDGSPTNRTLLHTTPPPRVLTRHRVEVPSAAATSTSSPPITTDESAKLISQLEPSSKYQDRARTYRASLVQRFSYALEARKSRFGEIRISYHSNSTSAASNSVAITRDQQQFDMECDTSIARWMGLHDLELSREGMDDSQEEAMELEAQKRLVQLNQQHPVTINNSIVTFADNGAVTLASSDSHPMPRSLPTSQLNQKAPGSSQNSASFTKHSGSHLTTTTTDHSLAWPPPASTHLHNNLASFDTFPVPKVNQAQALNHTELYDNDEVVPMELC